MNFFLADVQTGFGAFVAFYLAELGWSKGQVGLALAVGTLSGVASQIPGGALIDALPWKRALAAAGIAMICASALILALIPSFTLVFIAEILHGLTSGVVTPAIAAISLGLVGRRAMSARTGRNYRFDAIGNALTAGAMGLAGYYWAKNAIFLASAALRIPALVALSFIRGDEIDYARARNAGLGKQSKSFQRIFDVGKNSKLYIFATCVFLFQVADASMLPVVGQNLAQHHNEPTSVLMSGLIVVPQLVVGLLSPWVGHHSERFGRKPLLLLGFGLEIVRALLFALFTNYPILLLAQAIGGMSSSRDRAHHPDHHRSDHRHWALQLGARIHRHGHRARRGSKPGCHRFHFPGIRALAGVCDPGRSCRRRGRIGVDRAARDAPGKISGLT